MTTQFRRPGDQSSELETNERLGTEETLVLIRKLLSRTRRVSAGGRQTGVSVTSSAVARLTIPQGATEGRIYVRTASIVFSTDGSAPTASAGIQADATDLIILLSDDELAKFGSIAVSATATLDVEYFKYEGE